MIFKRKFAVNFRKNLKLLLAKMSFSSDFINGKNQNMYPVMEQHGDFAEYLETGHYHFRSLQHESAEPAGILRFVGQYTPYSNAEIAAEKLEGKCGFVFRTPETAISLLMCHEAGKLTFIKREVALAGAPDAQAGEKMACGEMACGEQSFSSEMAFVPGMSFIVSTRKGAFDLFVRTGEHTEYVTTFVSAAFCDVMREQVFTSTAVLLAARRGGRAFGSFLIYGLRTDTGGYPPG